MKYKILNNLQFYYQENVILVQLHEKYLTERDHIFDIEENSPYFLEVEEILTKDEKLEIVYNRPSGYTPLIDLKEYADFYKLDIVNRLLEMNVLERENTYLAMTNILLKDTNDLMFIYKADDHENLPYNKIDQLEQWKNFICSFFGRYSLEKYQKNRSEILVKEKNQFLNEVNQVESLTDLIELIKSKLTEEQQNFFSDELSQKKSDIRQRRGKTAIKIGVGVGLVVLYLGTVMFLKVSEKNQVAEIQQQADTEITILNKIIDNDSENIGEDMEKLNYPKEKQVEIYIKLGDYDQAFNLDPNADVEIVQNLYKLKQVDEIKELDFSSDYLDDFKQILSYEDTTKIDYLVQSSTDIYVINAIADQAIANKDLAMIKNIRSISIKEKKLKVDTDRQIKMIDTLIAGNNQELEDTYKNDSLSEESKKQTTNDLLEENNSLLSEKLELNSENNSED